jgi:hypothetical protein
MNRFEMSLEEGVARVPYPAALDLTLDGALGLMAVVLENVSPEFARGQAVIVTAGLNTTVGFDVGVSGNVSRLVFLPLGGLLALTTHKRSFIPMGSKDVVLRSPG